MARAVRRIRECPAARRFPHGGCGVMAFRTRHVVAISMGGMVIALSAALGLTVGAMRKADAAYARRLVAMGTIGRTGLGGDANVGEVLWQDQNHVSHTARFHFAYPEDWTTGEAF